MEEDCRADLFRTADSTHIQVAVLFRTADSTYIQAAVLFCTADSTHTPRFSYAATILTTWTGSIEPVHALARI